MADNTRTKHVRYTVDVEFHEPVSAGVVVEVEHEIEAAAGVLLDAKKASVIGTAPAEPGYDWTAWNEIKAAERGE